jgi:hypothetical protein
MVYSLGHIVFGVIFIFPDDHFGSSASTKDVARLNLYFADSRLQVIALKLQVVKLNLQVADLRQ